MTLAQLLCILRLGHMWDVDIDHLHPEHPVVIYCTRCGTVAEGVGD